MAYGMKKGCRCRFSSRPPGGGPMVSRPLRGTVLGAAVGSLPVPCAATAARIRQALEARVEERTRIARELHDTLLQSFHGLLLRFQTASYLLPDRPEQSRNRNSTAPSSKPHRQLPKAGTRCRACGHRLSNSTISRWRSGRLATNSPRAQPACGVLRFRVDVEGHLRELRADGS